LLDVRGHRLVVADRATCRRSTRPTDVAWLDALGEAASGADLSYSANLI